MRDPPRRVNGAWANSDARRGQVPRYDVFDTRRQGRLVCRLGQGTGDAANVRRDDDLESGERMDRVGQATRRFCFQSAHRRSKRQSYDKGPSSVRHG